MCLHIKNSEQIKRRVSAAQICAADAVILQKLGALAALEEAGYNKGNGKVIPVFGIDASEAARNKIRSGAMAGTIKQDADGMARAIAKIAANFKAGKDPFDGIDENNIVDGWRVNIPYSVYTGEETE